MMYESWPKVLYYVNAFIILERTLNFTSFVPVHTRFLLNLKCLKIYEELSFPFNDFCSLWLHTLSMMMINNLNWRSTEMYRNHCLPTHFTPDSRFVGHWDRRVFRFYFVVHIRSPVQTRLNTITFCYPTRCELLIVATVSHTLVKAESLEHSLCQKKGIPY